MELVASGTHSLLSADGTPLWLVQKGKFAYRILPEYTREAFVTCETRPTDWVKRNKVNEKKQGLPSEAKSSVCGQIMDSVRLMIPMAMWFMQAGRYHRMNCRSGYCRTIPWCRRSALWMEGGGSRLVSRQ